MSQLRPPELGELTDAHLGRLLLHALRRVQAVTVDKLNEHGHHGVRAGHLPVFAHIDCRGTRITELATRAGMTRQMMGRLVRELELLGYTTAQGDPADQRAVIVSLTDRGQRFCADAKAVTADLEREYANQLGPGRLSRLRASLLLLADPDTKAELDGDAPGA